MRFSSAASSPPSPEGSGFPPLSSGLGTSSDGSGVASADCDCAEATGVAVVASFVGCGFGFFLGLMGPMVEDRSRVT